MTTDDCAAYLTIRRPDGSEERHVIDKDVTQIDRDESCDLLLESKSVSRRHLVVLREYRGWMVQDLGSTNGTMLDDSLLGNSPTPLSSDDTITVSPYEIRFCLSPGSGLCPKPETRAPTSY